MMRLGVLLVLLVVMMKFQYQFRVGAIDIPKLRIVAAKNNLTSIFVFGDSSVDAGNNNRLATTNKGNFPPYGKDFFGGRPTGRFSNGKLATDFIAEALGHTKIVRAFLDPSIEKVDLLNGVSFASAGSGYDNLTAELSNVLSISHQLEYFRHYKIHLRRVVGEKQAEELVTHAVYVLSMGTNDFLQNYYVEPTRSAQFTVEQYQNYLISCLFRFVKTLNSLGARRLAVVGMVPFGCLPLVKTLKDEIKCDDTYNTVAASFNSKINKTLATLKTSLGMKTVFVDAYGLIQSAIQDPTKHGFMETSKGCCGTGTTEYGITCQGLSTCDDRSKYIFWDAVHPTEKMYKIIADEVLNSLTESFF